MVVQRMQRVRAQRVQRVLSEPAGGIRLPHACTLIGDWAEPFDPIFEASDKFMKSPKNIHPSLWTPNPKPHYESLLLSPNQLAQHSAPCVSHPSHRPISIHRRQPCQIASAVSVAAVQLSSTSHSSPFYN